MTKFKKFAVVIMVIVILAFVGLMALWDNQLALHSISFFYHAKPSL